MFSHRNFNYTLEFKQYLLEERNTFKTVKSAKDYLSGISLVNKILSFFKLTPNSPRFYAALRVSNLTEERNEKYFRAKQRLDTFLVEKFLERPFKN